MRQLSAPAQLWLAAVLLGGAIALGIGGLQADRPEVRSQFAEPTLWLLLIGACIAHAFPVIAPRHQAYHATQAFLMASLLVLAWPCVVLIVLAAHVAEWLRRPRPLYIQLYNVGTYLISAGVAFSLLEAAGVRPFSLSDARALLVALLAAGVMVALNHGLTAIVLWLARNVKPADSGLFGLESVGLDGLLLVVGIAIGGGLQLQPWSIVVTGSPLILIYRALRVANVESTSHRDQLTGLYNARHLQEALDVELRRATAEAHTTGLIVIAVDDIPAVVQAYGRATLDFLLVAVADRLRSGVREFDVVARLDEDTIGILLPSLEGAQLSGIARRVSSKIAQQPFALATTREPVRVSISQAYACIPPGVTADAEEALALLRQAAERAALSGTGSSVEVDLAPALAPRTAVDVSPLGDARVGESRVAAWSLPRSWLRIFEATVILAGLALSGLVLATSRLPDLPLAAAILGLVTLAELLAFELYDRSSFSVSFAPIVVAGLLGGPAATLLAVWSVAVVRGVIRRSVWHRVLFNGSAFAVTGVPALIVATAAGRLETGAGQLAPLAISTAVASSVYYLHTFLIAGAIALELGADPRQVWARNYRWLFPHYVVLGWMGLGLALATVELGPLGTALFVAPPLAMRVVLKQYMDRTAGAVHRLEAANAELRAASALLGQRGEELSLLSDLGHLVAAEPRAEALQTLVVARCVPSLGDVCAMLWQAPHGVERTVRSDDEPGAADVAEVLRRQAVDEVLRCVENASGDELPDSLRAHGGTWLAAPLPGTDQILGYLMVWSANALADEARSRRLTLMHEVAQRVALVLERDALLEEAAELEALRTIDRAKTDFIATTAHELRTPLTSLQGYTELLRTSVDPALRDRWLGILHIEAAQLGQVVDQLLDVSRLDSGRYQAERREFDLSETIQRVAEQFGQQAALSNHELSIEMPYPPRVFADPAQVERVLRNLLSNALKYSPEGGPISIVAVERPHGEVEVRVADRGLGIPADWTGRLFERFQRIDRPDRASIRGTGLGLYIARQLVELNSGRIWVSSEGAGAGASFHFTLPAARRNGSSS